jgi:hypothetical protein
MPKNKAKPLEYTAPNRHPYKIELPAKLMDLFGITEADLPLWHAFMVQRPEPWRLVRMLHGINPVLPNLDGDTHVVRVFTRQEVLKDRGWKLPTFNEYLDSVVELWRSRPEARPPDPAPVAVPEATQGSTVDASAPEPATPADEPRDDMATIQAFGFSPAIFELEDRDEVQQQSEIRWFASRLRELKKMFDEPMATGLARQAIINEMLLRRCDDQMTRLSPRNKEFSAIQSTKIEIEKVYQDQWSQLEEICPFVKAITNKVSFSASLSDVIEGWKQYRANGRNDLVDGLHNFYGLQILMRASTQEPTPRYRPGWVLACLEARDGLFDPNFKRKLPNHLLAALDSGLAAAHAQLVEEGKIKLTDLELEGPAGEYPPLVDPAQDAEIVVPEEPVKLE